MAWKRRKLNLVHRSLIKTIRHLQFSHTQVHYFCILRIGSDSLTKKIHKRPRDLENLDTLENLNCLWSGWINETSASNVPLGNTLSKGASEYTVQLHLTPVQDDNVPNLSW